MDFRISPLLLLLLAALPAVDAGAVPEPVWSDLLDGGGAATDHGRVVLLDSRGNPIVGGETTERVGGAAFFVRKMHRDTGAEIWSARVPAYDGSDMSVRRMALDPSGDVMVSGYIAGCGT